MTESLRTYIIAAVVVIGALLILMGTVIVVHNQDTDRTIECIKAGGSWQPTGRTSGFDGSSEAFCKTTH